MNCSRQICEMFLKTSLKICCMLQIKFGLDVGSNNDSLYKWKLFSGVSEKLVMQFVRLTRVILKVMSMFVLH